MRNACGMPAKWQTCYSSLLMLSLQSLVVV